MKDVIVIAGPNGAGKSTVAIDLLPVGLKIREFVNADEIARGLSPFNPSGSAIAAGRAMIRRIRQLADAGESFGFETTLSGRGYEKLLREFRRDGYRVTLLYLWLPTVRDAFRRVARRVSMGGHDVTREVILRRYSASLRNLTNIYLPLADFALIYDNSDQPNGARILEKAHGAVKVLDTERWQKLQDSIT